MLLRVASGLSPYISATFFMRYSLEAQIKTRTTLGVLPQHMARRTAHDDTGPASVP